ncbi:MAG: NnrS family protein [Pseudomonadaceae bacterium]|nr:NnrS family protein [Pseudomonadaceae bacterium]
MTTESMKIPLLALGFRPFYLLAGLFALIAVPAWLLAYQGHITIEGYLIGLSWHQHEMLFGFAPAVIAGFLLTAVRNWTGLATPTNLGLANLGCLWIAGRILAFTGPAIPAALIDVIFMPALAAVIALPILRSGNTRNLKLLLVLAGLSGANIMYHMAYNGLIPAEFISVASVVGIDIIVILMAIMSGRVIPAFTANAVPNAQPRPSAILEALAIGSLILVLFVDLVAPLYTPQPATWSAILFIAALAHGVRLWRWDVHPGYRNALLIMLPIAYLWIPLALSLRGLAALELLPATAATHALTIGAMSSLMLAMMMRSALGHTGRVLVAGPVEIAAFALLQLAAISRVAATHVDPVNYASLVTLSGSLYVLAFAVFLARYGPMLVRPRIDGQAG